MPLDYDSLVQLRDHDSAWRLLRAEHAPLVASFLGRVFIAPNVRVMPMADLVEHLEDELFALRERLGGAAYPKPASDYLNDWAAPERGWLRKFYPTDSDEPSFDLTPATEKALRWLDALGTRAFVGTESRLLTLFDLLHQIASGSESAPESRIAELTRQRAAIDAQIAEIEMGHVPLLDDAAVRDRFGQFTSTARELLSDFREVEHNFRSLDRSVRERITLWSDTKAALLDEVMGERDAIADSDEGRSFQAFWDFLMSSQRQEELTGLLDKVLDLDAVREMDPDPRTRRIHYDWLDAGGHAQRTVAQLSQQLRRFLDDQAWLENRRIMDIIAQVEGHALALREQPGAARALDGLMELANTAPDIRLPLERPLFRPGFTVQLDDSDVALDDEAIDAGALFDQVVVDRQALAAHVRRCLGEAAQVSLAEVCAQRPLEHGLAELVTYLQLASDSFDVHVDESARESIEWISGHDDPPVMRRATLPRVLFVR